MINGKDLAKVDGPQTGSTEEEAALTVEPLPRRAQANKLRATMRILILAALLLSCIPVAAQDTDGPKPDRWRGLVLDQSTTGDAIKSLGTPDNDRAGADVLK